MNKSIFHATTLSLLLFCIGASFTSQAHEAVDPLHATPIETVDSLIATLSKIHVRETDKGVEVKGTLKRRLSHKTEKLHGHIDVELLDKNGQTLERAVYPIKPQIGSVKHDHEREFFTILPVPSSPGYMVRVAHIIGTDGHQ